MSRRRRARVCSEPGCHRLTTTGRCDDCQRRAEQLRGTAAERGYSGRTWRFTRRVVLRRDPVCTVCNVAFSTVADHYPISRRDLVALGVANPDAPERLRGVCGPCHSSETAREQPGGWNRRD